MNGVIVIGMMLAGYIAFFVGGSVQLIGRLPSTCEPFGWWLPLAMCVFLIAPTMMGWWMGILYEQWRTKE